MMDILLRLLGITVERADRITSISWAHHGEVAPWVVLLVAVVFAGGVFWMYRRAAGELSAARRWTLAALRSLFLLMMLLILIRPTVKIGLEGSIKQSLLLLIDGSSSMQIRDVRDQTDDMTRAAIAEGLADPTKGLQQSVSASPELRSPSRLELVKAALTNDKMALIQRLGRDYDLAVYTFDREVRDVPIGPSDAAGAGKTASTAPAGAAAKSGADAASDLTWIGRLEAPGQVTALGDAVRDVLLRKRGQQIAGMCVITDGQNNSGSLPLEAAKAARDENVPLFIYGVGITSPRDIIVGNVIAPDVAFVRDEQPVTVRVKSQGLKGQSAELILRLNGQKVDEKRVDFGADGEQAVSMVFTPREKMEDGELTAYIEPRPDEVVKDNNESPPKHIRVIDGRIKVLHIEESPRWDFKYLQALLLRDRRVDYKCLLFDSDPALADAPGSPYIKQFPSAKDLADNFDVIVLGDVDPHKLGPTALAAINTFVAKFSGSLVMVAGKRYSPLAYGKTPIQDMLPVSFDTPVLGGGTTMVADKPFRLELTPLGKSNAMLKLADKEEESLKKWADLPPIYWDARVERAKPAAEVLMVDSDPAKASRYGKMPVVALQQYGVGSVLYVGTDNTWRWRKNTNDQAFVTFWSQVIQRMSVPHMLGSSKRTQLSKEREKYATGDHVMIYARLFTKDYEPVTDTVVRAHYSRTDKTGEDHEVSLRALPDQPGIYRAEFVAPAAGLYTFRVDSDPETKLDIAVTDPRLEMGETALNEGLLKQMATISKGEFFREENLQTLPDQVHRTSQKVESTVEAEVWYSPMYFLVMMGILTAEWILRKVAQLK